MSAVLRAGAAYGIAIFALGFVLGALRELLLAPLLGRAVVVWMEAPLLLAASWLAARWLIRGHAVAPRAGARTAMGAVAFGLLMAGEALVAVFGFGRTLAMHLASYITLRGALELLPQIAFALIPLLQSFRERRP